MTFVNYDNLNDFICSFIGYNFYIFEIFQQSKSCNVSIIKDAFGPTLKDELPGTPLPSLVHDPFEELSDPPESLVLFEKVEVSPFPIILNKSKGLKPICLETLEINRMKLSRIVAELSC